MSPCEVVNQGRQHQPREREQAQAPGEGFDVGHGDLRGVRGGEASESRPEGPISSLPLGNSLLEPVTESGQTS